MTKKVMVDYIEKTGVIINFDRNWLMRNSKDQVAHFYDLAVKYEARKNK